MEQTGNGQGTERERSVWSGPPIRFMEQKFTAGGAAGGGGGAGGGLAGGHTPHTIYEPKFISAAAEALNQ